MNTKGVTLKVSIVVVKGYVTACINASELKLVDCYLVKILS